MLTQRTIMRPETLLLAMLFAFLPPTVARGVTIADYSFGTPGSGTLSVTSSDPEVTAGDVVNSALGNFALFTSDYASQPALQTNPASPGSQDVPTAFSNGNFHSFTLTPDAGKALDLTTLTFDVGRGGSSNLPRNYGVRTNLTGLLDLSSGAVTQARPNFMGVSVNLSTQPALQGVNVPVTFQFTTATASSGNSLEWDNFVVDGDVVSGGGPPPVVPVELVRYNFNTTAAQPASGILPTSVDPLLETNADLNIDPNGSLQLEVSNPAPNYSTQPVLRVFPGGDIGLNGAVMNSAFFDFTITPASGESIDLQNLIFDAARGGTAEPRGFGLFSSADGFTSSLLQDDIPTQRETFTNYDVDLSAAPFQGLTGPLTFRLYVYSPNSGSTVEFDSLRLIGAATAVVPEPATLGLLFLGGVGFLLRHRRR